MTKDDLNVNSKNIIYKNTTIIKIENRRIKLKINLPKKMVCGFTGKDLKDVKKAPDFVSLPNNDE